MAQPAAETTTARIAPPPEAPHPGAQNMPPWKTGELIDAPSQPEGEEWITLITCGGRFQQTHDNGLGEYLDRDVVIAKRIA